MLKYSRRRILSAARNFSSGDSSSGDYYGTLGLKRSATQAEVKNAYFELSKVYHPDRAKETPENIAKFRDITEAYEVLGNVDSRRMYDRGMFTEEDFGNKEEDTDDPLKRYEREARQRKADMGRTFDTWTKDEYSRMRAKREEFRRYEEHLKNELDAKTDISSASTFIVFACCAAVYFLYEFNKNLAPNFPSRNKIENRVKNSSQEKKS